MRCPYGWCEEPRRGYGQRVSRRRGRRSRPGRPTILVFLDGDFSDHPEELPRLLEAIGAGADLVIGSRALGRREPGALLPQARFGNALACVLIRALYRPPLHGPGPVPSDPLGRLRADRHAGRELRLDLRDAGEGAARGPPGRGGPRLLPPARGGLEDHRHALRHPARGRDRSSGRSPATASSSGLPVGQTRARLSPPRRRSGRPLPPRPRPRSARPRTATADRAPSRPRRSPARSNAPDSPTCSSRGC